MALTLGPVTVMRTSEYTGYRTLLQKAYALHTLIWMHGENNPPFGSGIEEADAELGDAISRVPAPK